MSRESSSVSGGTVEERIEGEVPSSGQSLTGEGIEGKVPNSR